MGYLRLYFNKMSPGRLREELSCILELTNYNFSEFELAAVGLEELQGA